MKPPLKQHSTSTSYNDNYLTYSAIEGVSLAFFNYLDTKDGSELGFQCQKNYCCDLHSFLTWSNLQIPSDFNFQFKFLYTRDHEYLMNLKPISTSMRLSRYLWLIPMVHS